MVPLLATLAVLAADPATPAAAQGEPLPVTFRAHTAEYLPRERRAIMTGNPLVTMIRGDATLVCRRLVAERDEKGRTRKATCEGDVKLTQGGRVVTCAVAVFEDPPARVVCRGNPTLRDGESVVRGEELVYELDADRYTLRGELEGKFVQEPGKELPFQVPGGKR
jgi:lipopolysaccharide export system protein LptA